MLAWEQAQAAEAPAGEAAGAPRLPRRKVAL
jgi:hypothetical protein